MFRCCCYYLVLKIPVTLLVNVNEGIDQIVLYWPIIEPVGLRSSNRPPESAPVSMHVPDGNPSAAEQSKPVAGMMEIPEKNPLASRLGGFMDAKVVVPTSVSTPLTRFSFEKTSSAKSPETWVP